MWIHGGAWLGGSKDNPPALPLLRDGFAIASITYRFSQHATFPAQIEDCRAALRWLRANAREHHIDPQRIGVWGASAGGHLAALLGTTADQKAWDKGSHLDQPANVQAVVNWFGPADLLNPAGRVQHDSPESPESKLVGGPVQENQAAARAASPVTYASRDDAPSLHIHGDKDPLVPHQQSIQLHEALTRAGASSTLRIIPGGGHGDAAFRRNASLEEIRDFFQKHLRP